MDYFREHAWLSLKERIGARLSSSSFENYVVTTPEQKTLLSDLTEYAKCVPERRKKGVNVVLMGSCGTGKDHLSFCIANAAHEAGCSVNWSSGEEMFADARDAIDSRSTEADLIAGFTKPDFLWLSDPIPLKGDLTDWQSRFLYRVIDARYRRLRPMLVTVNVRNEAEFRQKLGSQISDRLWHGALRYSCQWPTYRT